VKKIKLMRSRIFEYTAGKRDGVLTVFVMVFDICCGKLRYGGILMLEGALKQEFYFNIIVLGGIHGRHTVWFLCVELDI
jgi:hypothetical protein